jgi:hypothetical protein
MSRRWRLNAPCPIILRTRGDGTVAAACAATDNPFNPARFARAVARACGNDGSHAAGFSGYIGP